MPNRMIRDCWKTSPTLSLLCAETERVFTRLIVCADDFGRYHGSPRAIASACFPLLSSADICAQMTAALMELDLAGLIIRYSVGSRAYIQLVNWKKHQRCRAATSKFPGPERETEQIEQQNQRQKSNEINGAVICCHLLSNVPGVGDGDVVDQNHDSDRERAHDPSLVFRNFKQPAGMESVPDLVLEGDLITEKTPTRKQPGKPSAGNGAMGEFFEQFWAAYPLKVGKIKALASWNAKVPLGQEGRVIEAVVRQVQWPPGTGLNKTRDAEGGGGNPHPTTWLNQGRWDDVEPEPKQAMHPKTTANIRAGLEFLRMTQPKETPS